MVTYKCLVVAFVMVLPTHLTFKMMKYYIFFLHKNYLKYWVFTVKWCSYLLGGTHWQHTLFQVVLWTKTLLSNTSFPDDSVASWIFHYKFYHFFFHGHRIIISLLIINSYLIIHPEKRIETEESSPCSKLGCLKKKFWFSGTTASSKHDLILFQKK